jgi:hypothetical protein
MAGDPAPAGFLAADAAHTPSPRATTSIVAAYVRFRRLTDPVSTKTMPPLKKHI